ncbi:UNVERIFIED_CONTAM: hypothetical protein Sindi_1263000, partial [Sesamum indicum]
ITLLLRKKQTFEDLSANWLADFKKSEEFQHLLADSALKYYYHGYWTCASQFVDAGYFSLIASNDFLEIHAGLADAPESNDEVPQELLDSLLHVPFEGEAPTDPEDPVVENVVPLKVVPLLMTIVPLLLLSKIYFSVFDTNIITSSCMRFYENARLWALDDFELLFLSLLY